MVDKMEKRMMLFVVSLMAAHSQVQSQWKSEETLVGDMYLSEEQVELLQESETRKARVDRRIWLNKTIPFFIETSVYHRRGDILSAMQLWQTNTCINFVETKSSPLQGKLIFVLANNTCSSRVGRLIGLSENLKENQTVGIDDGCDVGAITHELGHSIGFYHEHARIDRDDYVLFIPQNAEKSKLVTLSFRKFNTATYGVPYDLHSIMHYRPDAFSVSFGKNTLVPLDHMKHFIIGTQKKPSFNDIKQANFLYSCSDHCHLPITHCRNGGFVNKQCNCKCSPGFYGSYCQFWRRPVDISNCGDVYAEEIELNIDTKKEKSCVWWIKAPKQLRVQLRVLFSSTGRYGCISSYLEVRLNATDYNGRKICGPSVQTETFISHSNDLILLFMNKPFISTRLSLITRFIK